MSERDAHPAEPRRALRAMGRGIIGRCPNCGKGKLFSGFLALVPRCGTCGEPLERFEPDLLLALLVGLAVLTVAAHVFFAIELTGGGSPVLYLTLLFPITAVVTLLIIRPFKGGLVGLMWALHEDKGAAEQE